MNLWYKNSIVIIAFIIVFFPVGLFLMWKYSKWNKKIKWAVTIILAILLLPIFLPSSKSNQNTTTEQKPVPTMIATQPATPTLTPTTTSKPTSTPSPTPKPIEKFKIVVTSQIVKRINNKCRYFFDIRNKDTKPFEGSVTISLFTNELKNPLAGDTFTTSRPIEPELGTSQYIDANTCPPNIHGANGITKFKYTVKKGNDVVNSGEGEITDKFKDLDAYNF